MAFHMFFFVGFLFTYFPSTAPLKFNMEPEKKSLEVRRFLLDTIIFRFQPFNFGGVSLDIQSYPLSFFCFYRQALGGPYLSSKKEVVKDVPCSNVQDPGIAVAYVFRQPFFPGDQSGLEIPRSLEVTKNL